MSTIVTREEHAAAVAKGYPLTIPNAHHCRCCGAPCRGCGGRGHMHHVERDGTRVHLWCWWCVTPSFATARPYDGPADDPPGEDWIEL